MTLHLRLNELLDRTTARLIIGTGLARCRTKPKTPRVYLSKLHPPGLDSQYCVGFAVTRPNELERIRFTGVSKSLQIACKKALNEYLEAQAHWDLGLSDEIGRSGWACAGSHGIASERAYRELLERDALLTYFLCPKLQTNLLSPRGNAAEFKLAHLQCADPLYKVVYCARRLPSGNRWLLGGGCEQNVELAIEKALLEVAMLSKDWIPSGELERQPKLKALWPHWTSPSDPRVDARLTAMFEGSGTLNVNELKYNVSRVGLTEIAQIRYSSQNIAVGVAHNELVPMTFGDKWLKSEGTVRATLERRKLKAGPWLMHPML